MRSIIHWKPRYILDRIALFVYMRQNPDHPWLTKQANAFLKSFLQSSDVGFECGSGRSTIWLSQRLGQLTSIEHNAEWFGVVQHMLKDNNVNNVDLQFRKPRQDAGSSSDYLQALNEIPDSSLDFALVDGIERGKCALIAIKKVKPGGLLVVDNVERYLPSSSRVPYALPATQSPATNEWQTVWETISKWRRHWTSNGIFDTAIFFKP